MNNNLKLTKLDNKSLIESAFQAIENLGFHILDITYSGSYYYYDECDYSICNFHIKEIPRFLFAFWAITRVDDLKKQLENNEILWTDTYRVNSNTELLFFTQYERDIDKFKPSRSGFLTGIYRETWVEQVNNDVEKQVEEWNMYELEKVLVYMKKHPIKAYIYSGLQIQSITDEISGVKCGYIFLKEWFNDKKYKFKKWIKLIRHKRASIRLVKQLGDSYYSLIILHTEQYSPRIDIIIRRKKNIENYDTVIKLEKNIETFENKWFCDINISQYDLEFNNDNSSDDDLEVDAELEKRFIERLSYYYTSSEYDYDILWCNCEDLIVAKI